MDISQGKNPNSTVIDLNPKGKKTNLPKESAITCVYIYIYWSVYEETDLDFCSTAVD